MLSHTEVHGELSLLCLRVLAARARALAARASVPAKNDLEVLVFSYRVELAHKQYIFRRREVSVRNVSEHLKDLGT